MTTGVLYEVHEPSFLDRLGGVQKAASRGRKEPATKELLERFYPRF